MIREGRVSVDGQVVQELGAKADPRRQRIMVDGRPLPQPEHLTYWILHKPRGVVSTVQDPQGRRRVLDLLPPEAKGRLFPVGRLDADSEGLMLLTNDGEVALRITHPRYQVARTYRVWVEGTPSATALTRIKEGVDLEDGRTSPALVTLKGTTDGRAKLRLVLFEGRKREIRRMCEAVGHPVERLVRVGLGPLELGDLPYGHSRPLSPGEVTQLKKSLGLLSSCKTSDHGVKKSPRDRRTRRDQQDQGACSRTGRDNERGGAPGRKGPGPHPGKRNSGR